MSSIFFNFCYNMKIGERIKEFRKKNNLSQKDFANALGYSQAYVAEIENDKREPSRAFLKKLNSVFGLSSDFVLYGERKKPESLEKFASEGFMSLKFIQRLKKDLENLNNPEEFYSSLKIPKEIIEEVLEGKLTLNRTSVIELAQKLNQPVHEYLALSYYIPDEITKFVKYESIIELFRKLSVLTPNEIEEALQTISVVLKPYLKKYNIE